MGRNFIFVLSKSWTTRERNPMLLQNCSAPSKAESTSYFQPLLVLSLELLKIKCLRGKYEVVFKYDNQTYVWLSYLKTTSDFLTKHTATLTFQTESVQNEKVEVENSLEKSMLNSVLRGDCGPRVILAVFGRILMRFFSFEISLKCKCSTVRNKKKGLRENLVVMSNCAKSGRFPAIQSWDQFSRWNKEHSLWNSQFSVQLCSVNQWNCATLTLSKPGFFGAPKTKGGHIVPPLAKTLLPFSESIQVNFFWKLVQKWISWHNFGFHGNHG